jgi:Methyltransferase domain
MRLMLYYVNPERLTGIDPDVTAIDACKECGVLGNLAQSQRLATSLPVQWMFDLIYSYSVLTHLSLRSTQAGLTVLRKYLDPEGLLCITIRPVEFWGAWGPSNGLTEAQIEQAINDHEKKGFAFVPFNIPPVDGDIPFGTTSMTTEWIEETFPFWHVVGYDRGMDFFQTVVFLTPVHTI